jgi:hypothetical protein
MNRIALVVVVVVAACSSSKDKSPTPAASAAPAGDVDVCGLMPAATIAQITGKSFTTAEEDDTKSYRIYSCNYTGAGEQLKISILGKSAKVGYDANLDALKSAGQKSTTVPGLGDAAFTSDIAMYQLVVLYGDLSISVGGTNDSTLDQRKQIVNQLHDKLTAK